MVSLNSEGTYMKPLDTPWESWLRHPSNQAVRARLSAISILFPDQFLRYRDGHLEQLTQLVL